MRRPGTSLGLGLSLALLALSSPGAVAEDGEVAPVVRDLALTARLTSEARIVPGQPVRLAATIVNRSADATYPLVRPGDGSESGWREPHVFFTATRRGERGEEVAVEEKAWGRCGLHDADWQRGILHLAPGEELDLTPHLTPASIFFEFQREGRVEIRVHYAWTGGAAAKGGPGAPASEDLGAMKGVAPFELVSPPVILEVRRPVDVTLQVIGSLPVGEARTLADLLRVTVHNRTDDDIEFTPQHIQFVLGTAEPADLLDLREDVTPTARVRAAPLRAGQARVFQGTEHFRLLRQLRLRAGEAGTVKVAAVYAPGAWDRSSDRDSTWIRSEWVVIHAE